MITGLAAGFFVAFLFQLSPEAVDVREVAGYPQTVEKNNDPSPVFDFYTLLPESEIMLSEAGNQQASSPKQSPAREGQRSQTQVKEGSSSLYLLQAGSFRSLKDADRLRAQLLLWGLSPRIEKVSVGSGESWHRVQLGPFDDKNTLNGAQKVLAEHNVDSLLLKMR